MNTKQPGNTHLFLTPLAHIPKLIGGSGWEWPREVQKDKVSVAAMREAMDAGLNWIDTAPDYGLGHLKESVALSLEGVRERPYVFSRCGIVWNLLRKIGRGLKVFVALMMGFVVVMGFVTVMVLAMADSARRDFNANLSHTWMAPWAFARSNGPARPMKTMRESPPWPRSRGNTRPVTVPSPAVSWPR